MTTLGATPSNTELLAMMKAVGMVYTHGNTYVSGTGTAGSDNTAQDVKTVVLPANTLTQVGDRVRIRAYFKGDTGSPITATVKLNGVTISHSTDTGGTTVFIDEAYIHYIDATHGNIIEQEPTGTPNEAGALSAVNVAGFDWANNQNIVVSQDAVINNHIVVFCIFIDIFPKGI